MYFRRGKRHEQFAAVALDHALVGVAIPNREYSIVWPGFGGFANKPLDRTWYQTFLFIKVDA
jgi:hypothetical protein